MNDIFDFGLIKNFLHHWESNSRPFVTFPHILKGAIYQCVKGSYIWRSYHKIEKKKHKFAYKILAQGIIKFKITFQSILKVSEQKINSLKKKIKLQPTEIYQLLLIELDLQFLFAIFQAQNCIRILLHRINIQFEFFGAAFCSSTFIYYRLLSI